MKRMLHLLFAVFAAIIAAWPTIVSATPDSERAEIREIVLGYGDCVVAREPGIAADIVLRQLATGHENRRRYRRVDISDCLIPQLSAHPGFSGLRFPEYTYRSMLGEALVRRLYRSGGPADFSAVPRLAWPTVAPLAEAQLARLSSARQIALRTAYSTQADARTLAIFSECVVRRSPELVRRLSLVAPNGSEEVAQLATLQGDFGACVNGVASIRMARSILRGALMVSYFRLAYAVQPPADLVIPAAS